MPQRPFRVEFWDGTELPATSGDGDGDGDSGGPPFSVRSPRAVGHVLRAPGQLGLGRAYVSGELGVDDITGNTSRPGFVYHPFILYRYQLMKDARASRVASETVSRSASRTPQF